MNEQICSMCTYYCPHYMRWHNGEFIPVDYGHCIYGRTKMCRAFRNACIHFLLREESHMEGKS